MAIPRTIKNFREFIFIGLQNRESLQEKQTNAFKKVFNADQSNTSGIKKSLNLSSRCNR